MRSYYAHLETTQAPPPGAIAQRPTFRSSAIFPVFQRPGISSRILFMGYWILKRHIREIAGVVSLRASDGRLIARDTFLIVEAKTFRIELKSLLAKAGFNDDCEFEGSLEIEFFSTQNLFFPFPAVVINYYGPTFSTVVHTAQRVYNDFEDMAKNTQTNVPESGFNIYADEEREPFISLINGNIGLERSLLEMQFINNEQEILKQQLDLGKLAPFETKIIYPARELNLQKFLKGHQGAGKIKFQVGGIFPRLVVGNIHHKIPAFTITHSYYDCSDAKTDSDYWLKLQPGWHEAALMLPAALANKHFTNIYLYPIYSPASFMIDVEIYDETGKLLGSKQNAAVIEAPRMEWHRLPIKTIVKEMGIDEEKDYAVRLIARAPNDGRIPARIKIGLDVGHVAHPCTPCNICTNLQPFNPAVEKKPNTFRWTPVLADQPGATVWLMNSSPAVKYTRSAELTLTFFHEKDDKTVTRTVTLAPNGFKILRLKEDKELRDFFGGIVGWMTATTSNPYALTYYFDDNPSGVTGGDHGF